MTTELATAGIIICGWLALNSAFALYVFFAEPRALAANHPRERWRFTLFGLQRTLMRPLERYADRGLRQGGIAWLGGTAIAVAYVWGFWRFAPDAYILFWAGALVLISFPASVLLWPLRAENQ